MRSAAVGFQCPECVAEGAATVRQPRTLAGARLGAGNPVTTGIVILCVVVYLLQISVRDPANQQTITVRFGLFADGIAAGQYERLLTAAFLHASVLHLLFNMYALSLVGPSIERVLGTARYLALYLLAALGGSALSYLVSSPNTLGVGASGAVFGMFGAFLVITRKVGGDSRQILVLVVLNLAIGFVVPGIDWRAHIGGLVTGSALAAAFVYAPRGSRQAALQTAAAMTVGALIVAVVVARTLALAGSLSAPS